ncbi:hypothetical protein [Sessilibacter corallicola]|uniref:hypothetical protein n=1 Tax=Sessilibacter corallicola TaxID=2904075 RepID=UPI001E44B6F2|nr:hypothetical protein [Sessilibacter corallicola]MCE2026857.1 hypothetical protein [Sessilibacter corallicola]
MRGVLGGGEIVYFQVSLIMIQVFLPKNYSLEVLRLTDSFIDKIEDGIFFNDFKFLVGGSNNLAVILQ